MKLTYRLKGSEKGRRTWDSSQTVGNAPGIMNATKYKHRMSNKLVSCMNAQRMA